MDSPKVKEEAVINLSKPEDQTKDLLNKKLETKSVSLTECELVAVTRVFKSFETGLGEGSMLAKVRWTKRNKNLIQPSNMIIIAGTALCIENAGTEPA